LSVTTQIALGSTVAVLLVLGNFLLLRRFWSKRAVMLLVETSRSDSADTSEPEAENIDLDDIGLALDSGKAAGVKMRELAEDWVRARTEKLSKVWDGKLQAVMVKVLAGNVTPDEPSWLPHWKLAKFLVCSILTLWLTRLYILRQGRRHNWEVDDGFGWEEFTKFHMSGVVRDLVVLYERERRRRGGIRD
jgi:hypothetical protein